MGHKSDTRRVRIQNEDDKDFFNSNDVNENE